MSRVIKFRSLRDDMSDCNFKYGSLVYNRQGDPRIQEIGSSLFYTCIKDTEGMFTGLFDSKNKEIYEGDIINTADGEQTVIYDDGCFYVETEKFGSPMFSYTDSENNFDGVVVGNIHEV
jgi:hypothetical protein